MNKRARYRLARPKLRYQRAKRRPAARHNPDAKPVFNKQGGVYPTTTFELVRAKLVDLGTLPKNITGTNCGNCKHFKHGDGKIGYCKHPLIQQAVTARMCCAAWRPHGGWLRAKKAVQ